MFHLSFLNRMEPMNIESRQLAALNIHIELQGYMIRGLFQSKGTRPLNVRYVSAGEAKKG